MELQRCSGGYACRTSMSLWHQVDSEIDNASNQSGECRRQDFGCCLASWPPASGPTCQRTARPHCRLFSRGRRVHQHACAGCRPCHDCDRRRGAGSRPGCQAPIVCLKETNGPKVDAPPAGGASSSSAENPWTELCLADGWSLNKTKQAQLLRTQSANERGLGEM